MMFRTCNREAEVRELLQRGHWPNAVPQPLLDHVSECSGCGELVLVTRALRADRVLVAGTARLEAPGVLWWRAQLRRRNAAVERVRKPLVAVQAGSIVVSIVAAAVLIAMALRDVSFPMLTHALHLSALVPQPWQSPQAIAGLVLSVVALLIGVTGALAWATSDRA